MSLKIILRDAYPFKVFLDVMKRSVSELVLNFDRIRDNEMDIFALTSDKSILIHATINTNGFDYFECSGKFPSKGVILSTEYFIKCLKKRDDMHFELEFGNDLLRLSINDITYLSKIE